MKTLINANVLRSRITQSWQEGAVNTADMHEVMRLIDEARPEGEWTPVTEALPDREDDYFVTVKNDRGTRRRQVSSFRLFNDGTCYSWGIETSPVYTVVAWAEMMPMWEEEKNEA